MKLKNARDSHENQFVFEERPRLGRSEPRPRHSQFHSKIKNRFFMVRDFWFGKRAPQTVFPTENPTTWIVVINLILWSLVMPLAHGQDSSGTTPLPSTAAPQDAAATTASRQEAEENYNSLKGHIDDLLAAQTDQLKQIQGLRKEVEELRQQISKPTGGSVSPEDFKQLATSVQEIDRKRQADKELILNEMQKLGRGVSDTSSRPSRTPISNPIPPGPPPANGSGYNYTIKKGDTISLVAQGYQEQGIKVTTKQIMDANPGVNANKLIVGMKIFIPDGKKPAQ